MGLTTGRRSQGRRPGRLQPWIWWLVPLLAAVAVAAVVWPRPAVAPGGSAAVSPLPDATPPWLAGAPTQVQVLYRWAAEHRRELAYIPCYCGCDGVGHGSNADCYYRIAADGRLEYEPHAFG